MDSMKACKTVDEYLEKHSAWGDGLAKLRKVLLSTELDETIKWGAPCYTLDGKNVVGLAAHAKYVGLWFHQGVFLSDPDGVLVNAQEGKTKALRQWRFERVADIKVRRVKAYVLEAIENQRQGKVVAVERQQGCTVPPELAAALAEKPRTRRAFDALTPGRQREYAEHVASAKRAETRASRVEKILPMIAKGVGLNDKYRNC